ncbi:MAG: flagellar protein FlaG [Atribacterota bacterium]
MDVQKVTGPLEKLSSQGEKRVSENLTSGERSVEAFPREDFSEKETRALSKEKLVHLVKQMNTVMEALSIEARFSVHQPTHAIVVTLINRDTGEIVRQIPPEKLLDMVARLRELAGLFVDEVV